MGNKLITKNDKLDQTVGCKHSNPNICKNHSVPGLCAFVNEDNICKRPPVTWKKIFESSKMIRK